MVSYLEYHFVCMKAFIVFLYDTRTHPPDVGFTRCLIGYRHGILNRADSGTATS